MRTRRAFIVFLFLVVASGATILMLSGSPRDFSLENAKHGIFIVDLDGKNVVRVYAGDTPLSSASVSPDRTRIAFYEYSGSLEGISSSEIALVDIDGTGYRRITSNSWMDFQPRWISDREILFISNPDNVGTDIYVISPEGVVLRQLTNTIGISEADPDVKCGKVVFTREHSVWIMDINGDNMRKLTDPPGKGTNVGVQFPLGDYDPNLSPDCSKVVFSRLVGPGPSVEGIVIGDYDLYVYDIASGVETEISNSEGTDAVPEWSENGIIFIHIGENPHDRYDIHAISEDGSNRRKITSGELAGLIETGCSWFGNKILFTAMFFE